MDKDPFAASGHALHWIQDQKLRAEWEVFSLISSGCFQSSAQLARYPQNLVLTGALVKGKSWRSMSWQLLERVESVLITILRTNAVQ